MSAADGLCLSRDEVRDLTGTPIKLRQVKFLRANGIRHYLDAYGRPRVLRSAVEGTGTVADMPEWKPRKAG